ncbi:hypothetical protein TH61_14425 [Rufibacter sp. DG15C]|uniref:hypothetical protein n=1 Tax=Rufibacter sp. DG15C TaxID=1379909 RepID=UPI00078DA397|nr:hypothetical protein [Rufibacter sp. DG15C]AMM52142.1 hypothetical protein TH61_14425 [Rufibacter sp. DG15C]
MTTDIKISAPVTELEETPWTLQDLPSAQVAIVEEGELKEEKLLHFYESFSSALDLTAPENVLEKS